MFRLNNPNYYLPVIFSLMGFYVSAQDMSSPYSIYGIGDIDPATYNMNAGMGYTGIALKNSLFYNGNNPASASGMEKSFLIVDFNATGKFTGYHGNAITTDNTNNKDFTIKNVSMAIKVNSFWATGIGFKQFSSVNYRFSKIQSIEGSNDEYLLGYTGDGGLHTYYWNNSFDVTKHLSLGVTSSFISGPINQTETFIDNANAVIQSKRRDYYANSRFEFGAIYNNAVTKKINASIGITYAPKTSMNYERTLTVTDDGVSLVDEKYLKYNLFKLPASYGMGIAIKNKNGLTLAADYSTQNWSDLHYKGTGYKLVNANRVSAGVEMASVKQTGYQVTQTRSFQVGAYVGNSYLQVNNHTISEYGVTIGAKRSMPRGMLIGASLEAGVRGTIQDNLIKENYVKLGISLSFRDYIFSKAYKFK